MEDKKEDKKETDGFTTVLATLNPNPKPPILTSEMATQLSMKAKLSPKQGKHGKWKKTLMKEEVFKQIQAKLLERSFKLLNTQTVLAHGGMMVFKIKSEWVGVGKKKWLKKGRPEIVKNQHEIAAAINWEYGDASEDENPSTETEFFFIITKEPDGNSIRDQLNRVFGPSTQKQEEGDKEKGDVPPIIGMRIIKEPKRNEQ